MTTRSDNTANADTILIVEDEENLLAPLRYNLERMAMAETLQDGGLDDGRISGDYLRRILVETERMTTLVNDLLELTSLQSATTDMEPQPVELASALREEGARYADIARGMNINTTVSVPDDLPSVVAQRRRARQVIRNLLDNALKFTPEHGSISVSAAAQGEVVEVCVADTGRGIPQESLPHIFERFYKVERSRRDAGSGLGLAIVKNIVQAYGGAVRVDSREGEGSTLTFTLAAAGEPRERPRILERHIGNEDAPGATAV